MNQDKAFTSVFFASIAGRVIIVLLLLLDLLMSPDAIAAERVRVGIYENNPLVFTDDSGNPKGIFVDLVEYVAAKENWNLTYVHGAWSDCLERLERGEIDLLTAIAFSPERAEKYNFTYETVITNWGQVFVSQNSDIQSVLELDAKKIGVKMNDIHFLRMRDLSGKFDIKSRFIEADEYEVVFELIEANRVQAGLVNRLFGLQNMPNYQVKETPIMFNPIEVRFAGPKQAPVDFLQAIDIHLRRIKADKASEYNQILNRWLVAPTRWHLPDMLIYSIWGVGSILLVVIIMNLLLRVQVKKRTRQLSATNEKLTEQIQIRENAQQERLKYEQIVATSPDHMGIIDRSYTWQAINDSALKAMGKSREEVIGKKTGEIIGDTSDRDLHRKRLSRAFSGEMVHYRAWIEFPVAGRRYMDIVYSPIALHAKKIVGCVVNARDITERHELELKLEQANKMELMGTIAGGVAHDLNNILSGIVSYPDLLLMQLPPDSALTNPIQTIKKSGERAAAIVQDLLTLARRGVASKEPVNLNDIISSFLDSPECQKILSFHPGVRLKSVLSEDLFWIYASPVHLSKTVMNLFSNAAEAMPDGGRISITTTNTSIDSDLLDNANMSPGDYVLLEISDEGVGISQEDLENIFEPFYTKKVMGRSGTGLGLAIVWGTIMDHHGYVDVKNRQGKGAVFRLYFPRTSREAQAISKDLQAHQFMGKGETILIVDDMQEQRKIGSDILNGLGYVATSASSGENAIEYLKHHTVDLVILDMLMPPGIDGLTTYEAILKIRPGQKTIIASGYAENSRVKKAIDQGVHQFIKKPYTIQDIGIAVKKALA